MRARIVRWLYRRAGARYWLVVGAAEGGASMLVALVTVLAASTYFDPAWTDVGLLALTATFFTGSAVACAAVRMRHPGLALAAWLWDSGWPGSPPSRGRRGTGSGRDRGAGCRVRMGHVSGSGRGEDPVKPRRAGATL